MTEAVAQPRLLLVEDSDTQALHFRRIVEAEGFAVERTRTAEEALETLNDALPDLLVVDYRLPGMNGDELVRIVRQSGRTRTLPVLMLTGDDAHDVERQGLDSGANAYVPKVGGTDLLLSRMRSLLRQRRAGTGSTEAAGATFRQARILLVEPSATYRAYLRALLTGDGHAVVAIDDPSAIGIALAGSPADCVLLGGDDRFEDTLAACSRLEAQRTDRAETFEIVLLTDDADGDEVRAGLAAGADDVVPKSDDRDMLLVRVRAVVRRKLARDDEAAAAAREREREVALALARAEAAAADALAAANRELAATNERLKDTQAQLVQSAKMASLGELVAGIAHEINNPLAFILAHHATVERALQAAADPDAPDRERRLAKATERLASMRAGLGRIQDLVVKLRRFSRLDDGETSAIDIPEAIDAVLTLLQPKIAAGVRIDRAYGPTRVLECSPALVNQVVMNIVSNAADAVEPFSGLIRIETGSADGRFVIRITDNGPGIPDAMRERVFEPFFTTKDVGAGTGLGLAIAYGVVRAHGGTLDVGRGDAGGAAFTITIPEVRR